MAQLGDFLGRLFAGGSSRGLSGGGETVLPVQPELAFYNAGLMKHKATGDLISDPELLWAEGGRFGSRKGGLQAHLLSQREERVLSFTDVLIVLSRDDWARAVPSLQSTWLQQAQKALSELFQRFCEAENLHLLFPQRPMQFQFVEDGGPRMEGEELGLSAGEFVTGLLSNQYTHPSTASRALIAVHLNLPGVWESYYEVGHLYSDQALFTLGNHWLDNFSHPSLPRPALYRLQQQADGSFVHIIDPEVQDAYEITSQGGGDGPAVLTIQAAGGDPVAHLVLESTGEPVADPEARTTAFSLANADKREERVGARAEEDDKELTAIYDLPLAEGRGRLEDLGARTVVPEQVQQRILSLRERGALLQKVHFNKYMLGYDVYIGRGGEISTDIEGPAATLQVRLRQVSLVAHAPGVRLDGGDLAPGEPRVLEKDALIEVDGQHLQYIDLRHTSAEGWPYVGELRREGSLIHLIFGQTHAIGRARTCRVSLPDKPHNDNIVWRPELGDGATIRARSGEISKSQFYTDSIMVASLHADVDLRGEPVLLSKARHCYTFIRRGGDFFALAPTQGRGGLDNIDLRPGDEILIGNSVFEVDYPPADGPRAVRADASPEGLSADSLAAAIDETEELPRQEPPPPAGNADLPPAAGLGERGWEPPAVTVTSSEDSIVFGAKAITLPPPPMNPPPPPQIDLPRPPPAAAAPMLLEEEEIPPPPAEPALPPPLPPPAVPEPPPPLPPPPLPLAASGPPPLPARGILDAPSLSDIPVAPPAPPERPAPPPFLPRGEEIESAVTVMESPTEAIPFTPPPAAARPAPLGPESPPPPAGSGDVAIVDEKDWQLELSRPARLRLVGWMASGELTIGNHRGADIVIPENRGAASQRFSPTDYFTLFVRGNRARVTLLTPGEAGIYDGDQPVGDGELDLSNPAAERLEMCVLRRDTRGDPDFEVVLRLRAERMLPDPRARLLEIDQAEPMVRALFTTGLPARTARALQLGALRLSARFDGENLEISDYLASYRLPDGDLSGGWLPFFWKRGEEPFRTAPEDGQAIALQPGDCLLVGSALYRFGVG